MEWCSVYRVCVLTLIALCHIQHVPAIRRRDACWTGKWRCSDNECIKTKFRCNGGQQCSAGDDEIDCEQWTCSANRWRCANNNECIDLLRRCDGIDNCHDGSDEQNCGKPVIDCPGYVMEKSSVTCRCRAINVTEPYVITWPGHSQSENLTLTNVQRSDNGTQYTCRVTVNGVSEETVYTLRVAYGPFEGKVKVGPPHLVKNGSQPVTLTCEAEDTYPTPHYQWGGVPCQKPSAENTCTFIADPSYDNGHTATCRAESVALHTGQQFDPSVSGTATGTLRMNITFTPTCGGELTANSSSQYFYSPRSETRGYPNNAYCLWHIRAPRGQWLYLDFPYLGLDMRGAGCRGDYIITYDGEDESERTFNSDFCTRRWNPPILMTKTGLITVKFLTNFQRSGGGFRAVYKTLPTCGGNVTVGKTGKIIQSPGHPGYYPNNMMCVWHLTAPQGYRLDFTFNFFSVKMSWRGLCRWGSLAFKDGTGRRLGTYCGEMARRVKSKFAPFTSISNTVTMVFKSSFRYSRRGFSIEVKATRGFLKSCPIYVMENSNFSCTCGLNKQGNFTWPGLSDSNTLTLSNVQRSDDGKQFTCRRTKNGKTEQEVYILRIAHGPYDGKVSVSPTEIVSNGSEPIVLKCTAEDTFPTPEYEWSGVECQKGTAEDTCILPPDPTLGLSTRDVTCTAKSDVSSGGVFKTASKTLRLNATFIPNCGEDFYAYTLPRYFYSPEYASRRYPNNANCVWHIKAPKGEWLWLDFPHMQLDQIGSRCRSDTVTVYEGDEKTGRVMERSMCYRGWSPTVFMTTTGLITVRFTTNSFNKKSYRSVGFKAVFKRIRGCGGDLVAKKYSRYVQSPGYPVRYENNLQCVWTVTAPFGHFIQFTFEDFHLEMTWRGPCRRDSLTFNEGRSRLGIYCGNKATSRKSKFAPVLSDSNNVTIVFKTSGSGAYKGFRLSYKATRGLLRKCPIYVEENTTLSCPCGRTNGNFTWPGHSDSNTLTLTNVQRSDDGKRFTCRRTKNGKTEEEVYILRVTYGPYEGRVSVGPNIPYIIDGPKPITLKCKADDTYPQPDYEWTGVECQKETAADTCVIPPDPTSDIDGKNVTCTAVGVVSTKNFTRAASASMRLNVTFVPYCGEELTANTTAQRFGSPRKETGGYPHNLNCVWHIRAPKGQWLWMDMYIRLDGIGGGCRDDTVSVYDGDEKTGRVLDRGMCYRGWRPAIFMTKSGLITVKMLTNSFNKKESWSRGFSAVYKIIEGCGGDIVATEWNQTVQSPGYPAGYDSNLQCEWRITAPPGHVIQFAFIDFSMIMSYRGPCRKGYLSFSDGSRYGRRFCGSKERKPHKFLPFKSGSNNVTMVFYTGKYWSHRGFKLQFNATPQV